MFLEKINSNKDVILKIHSVNEKIAVLRSNLYCLLYVEIIDTKLLKTEIIELNNQFISKSFLNDLADNYTPKYENYFDLNDNQNYCFNVSYNLVSFVVDFENNKIAIESYGKKFKIRNSKFQNEPIEKSSIQVFNSKKNWIKKVIKLKRNNSYDEFLGSKIQFSNKNLIYFKSGYKGFINIWDFKNKSTFKQKLLQNKFVGKEYDFEYVRYFFMNKEKNIFGFLGENPTYGVDGLRIFDISNPYNLKIIYEKDYLDNTNRYHIELSKCENKIISLNFCYPKNFQINIDDFNEDKFDVIESSFNHLDNRIIDAKIFKEKFYCVITSNKIIFFDLIKKCQELVINRDDFSVYFISENIIFYQQNKVFMIYE